MELPVNVTFPGECVHFPVNGYDLPVNASEISYLPCFRDFSPLANPRILGIAGEWEDSPVNACNLQTNAIVRNAPAA